mmetsp:Transcript_3537/g.8127  ORF Transcript_3537/g.8127 Transcript_3537/m.8127 type:complete len:222 (-) Transcript_3537:1256-1921(-)
MPSVSCSRIPTPSSSSVPVPIPTITIAAFPFTTMPCITRVASTHPLTSSSSSTWPTQNTLRKWTAPAEPSSTRPSDTVTTHAPFGTSVPNIHRPSERSTLPTRRLCTTFAATTAHRTTPSRAGETRPNACSRSSVPYSPTPPSRPSTSKARTVARPSSGPSRPERRTSSSSSSRRRARPTGARPATAPSWTTRPSSKFYTTRPLCRSTSCPSRLRGPAAAE